MSDVLGQAVPSGATPAELAETLTVARVECERRRVTKSGKVKSKLSVVGVRCVDCAVRRRVGPLIWSRCLAKESTSSTKSAYMPCIADFLVSRIRNLARADLPRSLQGRPVRRRPSRLSTYVSLHPRKPMRLCPFPVRDQLGSRRRGHSEMHSVLADVSSLLPGSTNTASVLGSA